MEDGGNPFEGTMRLLPLGFAAFDAVFTPYVLILPDVTTVPRVVLRLVCSAVSDAEHYPGGNGITSGSMKKAMTQQQANGPTAQ